MKNKQETCRNHGKNVEFWRMFNRWTQQEFADMLGMSQNNVSMIEKKEVIDDETLLKLSNILGVDIEHLKECNHKKTLDACKSVINYIYNVQAGSNFTHENNNIDTYISNPLDKISELYERLLEAGKENAALKSENNYLKNGGK